MLDIWPHRSIVLKTQRGSSFIFIRMERDKVGHLRLFYGPFGSWSADHFSYPLRQTVDNEFIGNIIYITVKT